MKPYFLVALSLLIFSACTSSSTKTTHSNVLTPRITLQTKVPGNPAVMHSVESKDDRSLSTTSKALSLNLVGRLSDEGTSTYKLSVKALEDVNFHVGMHFECNDMPHADLDFLLPGLWYKRNLNVSEGAPSMSVSSNWMFREDRLSTPLVAAYHPASQRYYSLRHTGDFDSDHLLPYESGEVIQYGESDLGGIGFGETQGATFLASSYPVAEYPKSYTRKLQLNRPITVFKHLKKGEELELTYELIEGNAPSYSDFVKEVWQYAFDAEQPEPVIPVYSTEEVKKQLTNYYRESFTDDYPLKGYSGVHVHIDRCGQRGIMEVGFIGRVFLNALYALQYGEEKGDEQLMENAYAVYDSYLANGFTKQGFIREKIDYLKDLEWEELSIRRQSEGIMALLYFLDYEKSKGRTHLVWEQKIKEILDKFMVLQRPDYSFPRKFDDSMQVIDDTGGSSSCAVLPLTMAYRYFNDPVYLEVAENTAEYIKKESVDKGVYFSSTLDARCEDKEASIYITTAYYYLWLATGNPVYIDHASKSVYFALSYYYTWDVPFAQGQLLGDLGLKTRGWGNVSVENNHIDVYVFEFLDVLNWLSGYLDDPRLVDFAHVIYSSMQDQLLPVEGRLCGIAKPGYHPEVVQHTHWDYGNNGKGYYNTLFGPGWVVASMWTMMSPGTTEAYFANDLANR